MTRAEHIDRLRDAFEVLRRVPAIEGQRALEAAGRESSRDGLADDMLEIANALAEPLLPEGYRVEREEDIDAFRQEVLFRVFDADGDRVSDPVVWQDGRLGAWVIRPGTQTSILEPDEARARAAALIMAGDECDARNAAAS